MSIISTGEASGSGETIATMPIMIHSRYFVDQIKETLGENRTLCLHPKNEKQDVEQAPLSHIIKFDPGAFYAQT